MLTIPKTLRHFDLPNLVDQEIVSYSRIVDCTTLIVINNKEFIEFIEKMSNFKSLTIDEKKKYGRIKKDIIKRQILISVL